MDVLLPRSSAIFSVGHSIDDQASDIVDPPGVFAELPLGYSLRTLVKSAGSWKLVLVAFLFIESGSTISSLVA